VSGYLLDTHVALWLMSGDDRLPERVRATIEQRPELAHISGASLWEVAIKVAIGRLELDLTVAEFGAALFDAAGLQPLLVEPRHVYALSQLPLYHRDPFDRLLVAQCVAEGMTMISADVAMDQYQVPRSW